MVRDILIIDDSASIHALVKTALTPLRIRLVSALDPRQGLQALSQAVPDLILLDVDMPGMNGFEVYRRLRAHPAGRSVPVLFLTAEDSSDQKVRGIDLGAHDYITKPFHPQELRARVESALRTKDSLQSLSEQSMVDSLTGLFNRRYFDLRLETELSSLERTQAPLACLFIELDVMEEVGRHWGETIADDFRIAIARSIRQSCRDYDVVSRYGRDQFAVLAVDQSVGTFRKLAERIRSTARETTMPFPDLVLQTTASIGMVTTGPASSGWVLEQAKLAMLRARSSGGDSLVVVELPAKVEKAA